MHRACSTATPGQLGAQMFDVVVGFIWAWGIAWVIFTIAKRFMQIRVSAEAEIEGLDVPEFGALALPRLRAAPRAARPRHARGATTSRRVETTKEDPS